MMVQLTEVLQFVSPKKIVDYCSSLRASEQANILLWPTSFTNAIKNTKSTPKMLQKLSPFTNWMDHSILCAVVKSCNIPEAAALFKKFDDGIDTSQPVTKYPIPSPSHHMVPYKSSTHTILGVQLNLQLHHSTLKDVLDTQSLIQEKCDITPHCLQLLAVAKTNHTIIYWTIPKHVASLIVLNVLQHQSYLNQNGIQQIAVYPEIILATDGDVSTVGLFSFFTKVSSVTFL